MTIPRILAAFTLGALSVLGAIGAAEAATARASDDITIFAVPRGDYSRVLGVLRAGEVVQLDTCDATGQWCRVIHDGPTGWVPASYLIGSQAKLDATPGGGRSLTAPFLSHDDGPRGRISRDN